MLLALVVIDHDKQTLMEAAGRNNRHAYVDVSVLNILVGYAGADDLTFPLSTENIKAVASAHARLDNILKLLRTP